MLIAIDPPPGQYRNGTILQSMGRWRDASLVRFYEGTTQPVGGWSAFSATLLPQKGRATHAWRSNAGAQWLAVGTADNLVVYDGNTTQSTITPAGLATGVEDAAILTGYGTGAYGRGAYGSDFSGSVRTTSATLWTLANFGEELIACADQDGRIFKWALDVANPAAVIANAPTGNQSVCVTQERFIFALGAGGNTRKVQWCDREDYDTWTALDTNEAGDFVLNTVGEIKCGIPLRGQTLILTDNDAHVAQYVGPDLVYEFEQAGQSCGIISKNAAEAVGNGVFWMGFGSFYAYQGGQVSELPCEVGDYVFGRMSRLLKTHITAFQVSEFSEVWWFYPSDGATENDSYVAYNYAQGTWQTGTLSRTTGIDRGVFYFPLMMGGDKTVYNHETGQVPAGFPVYAETGPIAIGTGDTTFTARRVHSDEATQGEVTLTFKTRRDPNGTESTAGPYAPANPIGVRFTGRQMKMRIDGVQGSNWRVGVQRVEVEPRGRR
jgi:hypothetical protein